MASDIEHLHAVLGFTPDTISFAAWTSNLVLAPSSKPFPFWADTFKTGFTLYSCGDTLSLVWHRFNFFGIGLNKKGSKWEKLDVGKARSEKLEVGKL